ncbi:MULTISPECIES: polyamine ABC transporter substrate-binding protein [unclassified Aminobacter]|uniref:polyamine ABC transporter substrate-binding protein n=1 Tax=unclassified Aminobacter TaxID=2644704 RepID=UPI00046309BF|nr:MULTISPECIES: polyamine ABC transporter substrate-binding protein [unclassified Aminobacter]TWG61721.1 putrescine transport system substrate-binding protein [Aminobacter sp. J44]TWH34079.1 putrescine transport system substrate-binding protein [Aminobacter sp. J15]
MIRKALLLSSAALAAVAFSAAAQAQDRVVNVYNWSDYIDDSIISEFQEKTGIRVVYDVFDSNELLETKLLSGGSGYDVVVPTGNFLSRQIQAGVFQKLQKDKLPNLKHMWDFVSQQTDKYDPGGDYSINYMWGTIGLGYNVQKMTEIMGTDKIDSWDVLFKPENAAKFADCGVYMLDSPSDMVPIVLQYLGIDPNSHEAEDLAKAEEVLLSIRPHIRKFHSSEYINALANGDICLAVGWSGDVLQARDRAAEADQGVTVAYVAPKEGTQMWFDQMAIPADAPHIEEAHEFLNFIMEPEVIAKATNYVYFANGNLASQEFIDEEVLEDTAIYPDDEAKKTLFTHLPYDSRTQRLVTRLWTKVVTGQ